MADENIKDFTTGWVQLGVVLLCLLTFATLFMVNNNPLGLGEDASAQLGITANNLSSAIFQLPEDSDVVLNITANTNPTEGFLGSRDSVATSYSATNMARGFFTSTKTLISWIFSGDIGKMLLAVFGGLFGLFSFYYIVKIIRNGI